MDLSRFEKIFIDEVSWASELAQRLISVAPEKIEKVNGRPYADVSGSLSRAEFDRSKRQLFITEFKGKFFKRCPGAGPGLSCCNYFVLNLGLQCDMNCSYCYLQSFLNTPVMTLYSNIDQALKELEAIREDFAQAPLRVGTGEVVDSLSTDDITLFSHKLIAFFKKSPHWKLEFKTKSDRVEQLLHLGPANNVYVSWSINPPYIIDKEEHGTASFDRRLHAAERCIEAGFKVSFHIDPMIWHPEWQENYGNMIDVLTSRFSPEDVPILSVGALRFQPDQQDIMRERFGMDSWVTRSEVFRGEDGKLRYDRQLRREMFDFAVKRFKEQSPKWNLFFCMETPETWLKSEFRSLPKRVEGLGEAFNGAIAKSIDSQCKGGGGSLGRSRLGE